MKLINPKHFLKVYMICFLSMLAVPSFAQNMISGIVKDDTGEPVIGASVVVKGNKSSGTVTDLDGKYEMEPSRNATNAFVNKHKNVTLFMCIWSISSPCTLIILKIPLLFRRFCDLNVAYGFLNNFKLKSM